MGPKMRGTEGEPPLACNFGAMDAGQMERYQALRRRLGADPVQVRELDNGYAFGRSLQPGLLVALAEYVSLERLCCPFFDFVISVRRGGDEVWLEMTGPERAKGILEATIGGYLQTIVPGPGADDTTV